MDILTKIFLSILAYGGLSLVTALAVGGNREEGEAAKRTERFQMALFILANVVVLYFIWF